MNLDEIQAIFFQECEEGLGGMETAFTAIRAGDGDAETINTVFRCVHSIKGGAGAFGHERLQAYTHEYETLLDLVRNGTLALDPPLLDSILAAFDLLADHVAAARDGQAAPADAAMLDRLKRACDGSAPAIAADPAPVAPAPVAALDDFDDLMAMLDTPSAAPTAPAVDSWHLSIHPAANAFDNGAEPLLLLRELAMLGGDVVAVDLSALPPLDSLDPDTAYLGWDIVLPGELDEHDIRVVFDFTDGCALTLRRDSAEVASPTAEPEPAAPAPPAPATAVVVPLVDRTPPVARPPVAAAAASQTIRVDLDKLDRLVNLVGELVITQAMLAQRLSEHQLGDVPELSNLDHLTRELQESTMAIRAQPMKTVFSRVPRIIRELEGETGKRVRLNIEGEMTEVDKTVVERIGEPLTHLIRNAVDHGLESTEQRIAAGKSEEGVVRLSAAHHSGRIGITSKLGEGSSFSLSLPLTLTVLDGMIVTVGAQSFVIPLGHIVESLRPDQAAVNGMGPSASLLDVRGAYVPVHRIAERLGIEGAETDPAKAVLIVVDGDQGQAALMVDAIQDQRQVVVKSLEANYRVIDGLAGATILGDGRVALILDVDALTARRARHAAPLEMAA